MENNMRRIRVAASNLALAERAEQEITELRTKLADCRYALCLIANSSERDPPEWPRQLAATYLRSTQ